MDQTPGFIFGKVLLKTLLHKDLAFPERGTCNIRIALIAATLPLGPIEMVIGLKGFIACQNSVEWLILDICFDLDISVKEAIQ